MINHSIELCYWLLLFAVSTTALYFGYAQGKVTHRATFLKYVNWLLAEVGHYCVAHVIRKEFQYEKIFQVFGSTFAYPDNPAIRLYFPR